QLLDHEVWGDFYHRDIEVMAEQAARRFEAEQTAADHDGAVALLGVGGDGGAVVQGAEDEDAALPGALDGRHERPRAGGQDEIVVRLLHAAVAADDDPAGGVDAVGADAAVDEDAAAVVPVERVEPEAVGVVEAAQDGRKEDAVVGAVGFGAEHADVEAV